MNYRHYLPILASAIQCICQPAQALDNSTYKPWQLSLTKYVNSEGLVNYRNWKSDRKELDKFITTLAETKDTEYNSLKQDEKIALWINSYNALTVKQILDNYPIKRSGLNLYPTSSIRQIDGVWDKQKFKIAGRTVTLHNIENDILRKEFKEPLIHFAINCASKSCPPLSAKAYQGATLNEQLQQAATRFVQSEKYNQFNTDGNKLGLSKIFEWYAPDFTSRYFQKQFPGKSRELSSVLSFIEKNTPEKGKAILKEKTLSISYLNYDWSLNEQGK